MKAPFLLCDPALLLPPEPQAAEIGLDFWPRLVAWSANRRVRIGPETLQLVYSAYEDLGWPTLQYPACPAALQRTAHRALAILLSRGHEADETCAVDRIPTLSPHHTRGDLVEEAIGHDAAALASPELIALATSDDFWSPPQTSVTFDPPPPDQLPLSFDPSARLQPEVDVTVSEFLVGRRVTIIGGTANDHFLADLGDVFDLVNSDVRWIASEPGKGVKLDFLEGLRPDRDVVFCVVGHIGHPESIKVEQACTRRGVPLHSVDDLRDIIERLRARYGD